MRSWSCYEILYGRQDCGRVRPLLEWFNTVTRHIFGIHAFDKSEDFSYLLALLRPTEAPYTLLVRLPLQ